MKYTYEYKICALNYSCKENALLLWKRLREQFFAAALENGGELRKRVDLKH